MPSDARVVDFMEWLANELATISYYMAIGQECASFISIRAFAQALEECGCDHLDKVEVKDPQSYWNAPSHRMTGRKCFLMGSGVLVAGISLFLGLL